MHYIRNAFAYMERTGGKAAPRAGVENGRRRQRRRSASTRARAADRTTTSTSTPRRANPEHWTRLLKADRREDLIGDPRYARRRRARSGAAEVDEIVSAWTRQHDKNDRDAPRRRRDHPGRRGARHAELADDPTFEQRGIRQTMAHPTP